MPRRIKPKSRSLKGRLSPRGETERIRELDREAAKLGGPLTDQEGEEMADEQDSSEDIDT